MTGYTTRHNIPYPTSGDPIYLGANQMRALAERVDAVVGTGTGGGASGSVNPGANTLAQRDAGGRVKTSTPVADLDAVNIAYLSTWLNNVASTQADADRVARRDTGGRLSVATPTAATHAATKAYVDTAVGNGGGGEGGGGGGPVAWQDIEGKPNVVIGAGINEIRAVSTAPPTAQQVPGVLYVVIA